jgi:predicted SprT family Zn-dependent metalloprotease
LIPLEKNKLNRGSMESKMIAGTIQKRTGKKTISFMCKCGQIFIEKLDINTKFTEEKKCDKCEILLDK